MRSRTKWILFNLESAVDHERLQAIVQAAESTDPLVLQALANVATSDPSLEHRHHARRSIQAMRARLSRTVAGGDGSVIVEAARIHDALASKDARVRTKAVTALAALELPEKPALLKRLAERETDPFVRAELVKSLVVLGEDALATILPFLRDRDVRVKVNAIEALQALGTPEAFTHVIAQLLDAEERVRRAATAAINHFGRANLLRICGKMLSEKEPTVRDAAVNALALVRLPETLPLLARALEDPVKPIAAAAAEGLELLAQAGLAEADAALEDWRMRATGGEREPSAGRVSAIIERGEGLEPVATSSTLDDFDPERRIAEIKRIIRMKAYERTAELVARLKVEQDLNVISCLVLALGRLKAREHLPLVRKAARSPNDRVRANAIESLGLMEDRSAHSELIAALRDASGRVRVNAILGLRGYPGHDPHALLADCLASPDATVRRSALYGLMELRDSVAVGQFERALSDADAGVRETAMEFLAILKSEGVKEAAALFEAGHAKGLKAGAGGVSRTSRGARLNKYALDELLYYLKELGGSDLHLNVGVEPCIRLHGNVRRIRGLPLTADDTKRMLYGLLSEEQVVKLERNFSIDFSYTITGVARFRVNVFRELRGYKGVFRLVPMDLPTLDGLSMPATFRRFSHLKQGLVLVTGPTGMGKSTTLAAMINEINSSEQKHIITVEDPVEFLHPHRMSIISQRELSVHAHSFAAALRDALREDPNVILVGEMRDLDTVSLAVTAAETGHLVLSTLHTASAGQSVNRIVDVFPPGQQEQARQQLSNSLQAIISQRLVPAVAGGRVLAVEVMVNTPAIANLIRDGKTEQLYTVMQVSHESGMLTLDAHLLQLVQAGTISKLVGLEYATDKKSFAASIKAMP